MVTDPMMYQTGSKEQSMLAKQTPMKSCRKKSYDAYVCKPEYGTLVTTSINVRQEEYGNKVFYNRDSFENLKKTNPKLAQQIQQGVSQGNVKIVTKDNPYVIVKPSGRIFVTNAFYLSRNFTFVKDGKPQQITQELLNSKGKEYIALMQNQMAKEDIQAFGWTLIRPIDDDRPYFGSFIQSSQGSGFSVALGTPEQPQSQPVFISMIEFATEWNNKGWTKELGRYADMKDLTIDKLPKINKKLEKQEDKLLDKINMPASMVINNLIIFLKGEGFIIESDEQALSAFGFAQTDSCRFRLKESESELTSNREMTVFFKADNKKKELNVRCQNQGKVIDEAYKFSKISEKSACALFLVIYFDLCKKLKITPFASVTKLPYLRYQTSVSNGYADNALDLMKDVANKPKSEQPIYMQINSKEFQHDIAERAQASVKTKIRYYDYAKKPIKELPLDVRVYLDKDKIQSFVKQVKSSGDYVAATELDTGESFSIKMKVGNSPVQQLSYIDVLCGCYHIMTQGYYDTIK